MGGGIMQLVQFLDCNDTLGTCCMIMDLLVY